MIKSENEVYTKCKTFSKKLMTSAVILSIMLPSIPASYANPEEEGRGSIRVYRTSNKAGTLVAPEALNVEYLEVNPAQKKLIVFQASKEPQEINSIFHPSNFPWQLSQEKMESFLSSQSFLLKQLDDGEYKLDMHTIGLGGVLCQCPVCHSAARAMRRDGYSDSEIEKSQERYHRAAERSGEVLAEVTGWVLEGVRDVLVGKGISNLWSKYFK